MPLLVSPDQDKAVLEHFHIAEALRQLEGSTAEDSVELFQKHRRYVQTIEMAAVDAPFEPLVGTLEEPSGLRPGRRSYVEGFRPHRNSQSNQNVLGFLPLETQKKCRHLITALVLATSLHDHFEFVEE
ncbi:unnamed protein product, partial [Symbiodinium sp. KB8]